MESNALLSLSFDTLVAKNKVSTNNDDKSSAVVKPAKEIDESASVVVGYGMKSLMKSSSEKLGSFAMAKESVHCDSHMKRVLTRSDCT